MFVEINFKCWLEEDLFESLKIYRYNVFFVDCVGRTLHFPECIACFEFLLNCISVNSRQKQAIKMCSTNKNRHN